jgi:hypothetical protein
VTLAATADTPAIIHALHLQQQVFFGTDADGAVEEHQFDAAALQFLHQQHLPGVLAG